MIPTIDMTQTDERDTARQLHEALTTVGFACLVQTGVWERANAYAEKSKDFFLLDRETKAKFTRLADNAGWVCIGQEKLNSWRPGDYKECFNIMPQIKSSPRFPEAMHEYDAWGLWNAFEELSYRVLRLIAIGLNLKDPDFLSSTHNYTTQPNGTMLRVNFYPKVDEDQMIPGQVRCAEHADYGSITLLYTDSPGLEVLNRQTNQFMSAGLVEGGIYVNIGNLLQMWSSDVLIANQHRVLTPSEINIENKDRISIAFFAHPDDDIPIKQLDGSTKYPTVTSREWLDRLFAATYRSVEDASA